MKRFSIFAFAFMLSAGASFASSVDGSGQLLKEPTATLGSGTTTSNSAYESLLKNTYVSDAFLDYLEFNAGKAAYNSITVTTTDGSTSFTLTFSELLNYFRDAKNFVQVGNTTRQAEKDAFEKSGRLEDIPTGEIDPSSPGGSQTLPVDTDKLLSGEGLFFVSDASEDFKDQLQNFVFALKTADGATNSNRQLNPEAKVGFYTTNDVNNSGQSLNVFDVAGLSTSGSAIVNVPIDGGLSFLALGGIAFGAARFRRRK